MLQVQYHLYTIFTSPPFPGEPVGDDGHERPLPEVLHSPHGQRATVLWHGNYTANVGVLSYGMAIIQLL